MENPFHIPNREASDKAIYLALTHEKRKDAVFMAICAQNSCFGLNRCYQASSWKELARIRSKKAVTKLEKLRRKHKFIHELINIVERNERIKRLPLP